MQSLSTKTKIILGILIFLWGFGLMGGILRYGFRNMEQAAARTEADFTTETFTIKKIDHMKQTRNGQTINDYFVLYTEEETFALGIPWRWMTKNDLSLRKKDVVEVKMLKNDAENYHKWRYSISHLGTTTIPIYQLTKDGEIIYETDITRPAFVETFQIENLLGYGLWAIFIIAIVWNIIKFIRKKLSGDKLN